MSGQRVVTGHKLIEEFDFLVLKRPGTRPTGQFPTTVRDSPIWTWTAMIRSSSRAPGAVTDVRNCLKDTHDYGASPGLVPAAVLAFMRRHRLYIGPAETRIARASSGL